MRYPPFKIQAIKEVAHFCMSIYKTILVVHPAAIGDAVMGTPVAHALKANFPDAKVVYLTHGSLFPLLELSQSIDVYVEWSRDRSIMQMVKEIRKHDVSLVIDLVASIKTRLVCALSGARVLTYKKHKNPKNWAHVVDNYMATLEPLKLNSSNAAFPSLKVSKELIREIEQDENLAYGRDLIALVPGVGVHRPNRAWALNNWVELGRELLKNYAGRIVLIGGEDDRQVCHQVKTQLGERCTNRAGEMTLVETAAVLSRARFVISADTGPAHIASAVGTKVICLTGPTDARRTGPYAGEALGLSAHESCLCRNARRCVEPCEGGSGKCMLTIETAHVIEKVKQLESYAGNASLA